ncbi:cap-specific mRNA (nucleoside-2'-O-)-methyltransferase 1 [Amyelois transitella]|uniref:cap-specific mRNA (nucleoside-2'-O-)-methyltransferase 1 n=1 Tax=Amyelois transitella TaxID=680683 RepID=UPI00067D19F4|nr:cap-specific mRNA (nucleoside-2'-O-)-methyltransferase 1 [Amyelois transitella]
MMTLSDPSGDEDSGSDESVNVQAKKRTRVDTYSGSDASPVPQKRSRADTYASTTSHGSVLHESDEEPTNIPQANYSRAELPRSLTDNSPGSRRSRSSSSENCSSPISDQYQDYQPSLDDNVENGETSLRLSFQDTNDNKFYGKSPDEVDHGTGSFGSGFSEKSKRMMSMMGFKVGKGLGKFEHGRVDPVEASTQKGRRGLGLKPSVVGQVPQNFKWSPDDAEPEAKEIVDWMPPAPQETLSGDILDKWLSFGPKKLTIDDETDFVDVQILKGVLDAKTIFDSLDDEDLRHARFRSNPYETIGAVIFLNRAAVKMANLDAVFDFIFTNPKKRNSKERALDEKELLYFADVCAGPGGFSEYVLYRKGWKAKGFGFTLKGRNDFKLSDFYAGSPETFNPYYGVNNDGNIFDPDNLESLKEHVLRQTDDIGVHFLMADGGFSVEGQENIQEILSKQLYLCQCLAALMLVRTGGHFVVKLFDVFTLFSVGLIYIMYRCFDKVCIHKPVTSRPANSERYLICLWKRPGTEAAENHLFKVNKMLGKAAEDEHPHDIPQLVPLSVMQEDTEFYNYIYKSNCVLGERQIKNLLKIAAFSKDKSLKEPCQAKMREECLKLWNLPDQVRIHPERHGPEDTLKCMLSLVKTPLPESHNNQGFRTNVLNKKPVYLEHPAELNNFRHVYDWHCTFVSSSKTESCLRIFMGCGGRQVYQLEENGWRLVTELQRAIPANTLIYGEIVKEYRGEGNQQLFTKALHVIDGMVLGGIDITHMSLSNRINQCDLFCNALNKPFDRNAMPIRCKRFFNMENFPTFINHLQIHDMKRNKRAVIMDTPNRINGSGMFYTVGSVLFLKEIKEPWIAQMSKNFNKKYYFCVGKDKKPRSEYILLPEATLDMIRAYMGRVMWSWDQRACAIFEGKTGPEIGVSRADVEHYVLKNTGKA